MNWFYVENNEQQGPVSESELEALSKSGRVNADTLVWRQGMPQWQPMQAALGRVSGPPPVAVAVPGGSSGGALAVAVANCVECHRTLPTSEMINLNQNWVCPDCKPVYLQKLAEGVAPTALGILWRSKKQVVTRAEAPFPDRCFKCNAPANGYKLKRKLTWHHSAIYLVLLINLLIYLIVALCVRKTATVRIPLCEQHRKQRLWFIAASWLAVLGGFAGMIVGFTDTNTAALVPAGFVVLVVGIFLAITKGTACSAARIKNDVVWIRGAGKPFLNELPEWTGPN